ncbi:MAG: hypothetical protein HRU40_04175 [Saprospiraceae bacterium]|nr:hypothetical protein [Saprospiraceae bacterium]
MSAKYVYIAITLLVGSIQLFGQATVEGRIDKNDILIGDQFSYTLTLGLPQSTTLGQIDWEPMQNAEGFEVLRLGKLDTVTSGPDMVLNQVLTMTSFDSGSYYLPEVSVVLQQNGEVITRTTNPIPIRVRTVSVPTDSIALQPIKSIVEEPLNLEDVWPFLALFLGLIIVLIIIRLWWMNRNKRAEEPAYIPPRPAHEIAMEKLASLEQSGWLDKEDYKTYQSELTYILREYLEGRFNIQAMESTTAEIIKQMETVPSDNDWAKRLRNTLHTADLVKFAKAMPPRSFHEGALRTVRDFVESTQLNIQADILETNENE